MTKGNLTVGEIMTTEVVTIGRNDALTIADELMNQKRIRHLLVLDDDEYLCGVVSQRDLFRGALIRALGYGRRAEEMMLAKVLIKEVMVEAVHTVAADVTVEEAGRQMVEHQVGCLPVVEGEKILGIITEGDFVRLVIRGAGGDAP